MKISQSTVALQSQHASASLHTSQTSMRAWVGRQRPDFEGQRDGRSGLAGIQLTLSDAARAMAPMRAPTPPAVRHNNAVAAQKEVLQSDARLRFLINMVQAITGRAVRVFDARDLQRVPDNLAMPALASADPVENRLPERAGWGLEIDTFEALAETESTQVSVQGMVKTADGQQINFTLQLEMSRAFVQTSSSAIRAGDAAVRKDPLVINFGGAGVELADTQFAFDLDADGHQENIAFVAGGSGFLAFDKNGDGQINNGTELFGARSGDGFADLAEFDQDGNQWIDENDAIYRQLKVWQRDTNGQDRLTTLAQAGVGALYLGRVASPFSVNTADNRNLGQVRSTGVFLYESGQVGSLQQVDL